MDAQFKMRAGRGIVTVTGALSAANVDAFREQFTRWLEENEAVRQLVLDLAALEFLDSAGLGSLIALLKRLGERGGDVRIANLQKRVRVVFEITRAYKIFEIFDSVDEALKDPT